MSYCILNKVGYQFGFIDKYIPCIFPSNIELYKCRFKRIQIYPNDDIVRLLIHNVQEQCIIHYNFAYLFPVYLQVNPSLAYTVLRKSSYTFHSVYNCFSANPVVCMNLSITSIDKIFKSPKGSLSGLAKNSSFSSLY